MAAPCTCWGWWRRLWPPLEYQKVSGVVVTLQFPSAISTFAFPASRPGCPPDGVVVSPSQVLPSGYWYSLLYATAIALLCLLVCLVGAHIYAKATFLIFLVVMFVLATIFISFFAVGPRTITLPSSSSPTPNLTGPAFPTTANFTGFKLETLLGNLWGEERGFNTFVRPA